MVVPRFIGWALKNEPIEIYGDGRQTRCFCCVFDVIRALEALMKCPTAPGRVFNLGSDEEVTIEDLADRIIRLSGSSSTKKFRSYEDVYGRPFDDMIRRVPDLKRICEAIGFTPAYSLDSTLRMIIEDMQGK